MTPDQRMRRGWPPEICEEVTQLVYELLDAHHDTVRLVSADVGSGDASWLVHADYLRDLQRIGRRVLAHASAGSDS